MNEILFPSIITNIDGRDQSINIINYDLAKNRTIYVTGEISDWTAMSVIAQLGYLDQKSDGDITLVINSPGGSVTAGLAIYDTMKYGTHCDVITVAAGMAASMGAILLASGKKGKRFATPSAEIMIHQPMGGVQGQATDISLVADHIQQVKKKLATILAEGCGRPPDQLIRDMERDKWQTGKEALEYGLIDYVGYPNMKLGEGV